MQITVYNIGTLSLLTDYSRAGLAIVQTCPLAVFLSHVVCFGRFCLFIDVVVNMYINVVKMAWYLWCFMW